MEPSPGPGMPGTLTQEQLIFNSTAAAKEAESFRHKGPQTGDGRAHQDDMTLPSCAPMTGATWTGHPQQLHPANQSGDGQDSSPQFYFTQNKPVPVFQKACTKCSWRSIASTDSGAYMGAVADLELHIKEAHGEVKNSSNNTASEEYANATRLRDVPPTQDDALNNLSVVRYWSAPLNWKQSQLNLPRVQTPLCTVIDYEPIGLEANNRNLLKDLHDRTTKKLTLKHFSDRNLKLIPSQQENFLAFEKGNSGNLYTRKEWKELTSEREAIKACHNYMELSRSIHPLDAGPQILYKVMLEKFLNGGTTAAQLESFFASVTWELANRAAKAEVPYKHAELLLKWDQMYRNSLHTYGQPTLEKQVADMVKRALPPQVFSPQKQKRLRVHNWCMEFNTAQGCSNPVSGSGCMDNTGRSLKHGCNIRKGNSCCNAPDHNRITHTD